jgi:hypothetical protein
MTNPTTPKACTCGSCAGAACTCGCQTAKNARLQNSIITLMASRSFMAR